MLTLMMNLLRKMMTKMSKKTLSHFAQGDSRTPVCHSEPAAKNLCKIYIFLQKTIAIFKDW